MSESLGSILELSKVTLLNNINLLIVTDGKNNVKAIADCLYPAGINFTYDIVNADCLNSNLSSPQKYNAILYDCNHSSDLQTNTNRYCSLAKKLQWWCHYYPYAPLILITDSLDDERAIKLVQNGVSGYIRRNELYQLPSILEKSLFTFVNQQALIEQQQNLIEQQRQQIQQLQTEVQTCTDRERCQQELIEHQHQQIQQLQTKVQTWIDDEKNKQEHLAYLSHELRSPVSSMLGFARMLKEQYYGILNDKQMQYVNAMVKVGDYMLKLVNNYLDLAKINAEKQTLDFQKLPVEEICQSCIAELTEKARQKGLNLNLDLEKDLDFCTVDPVRFQQILINLLSNAIKFTDEGSVTLQVKSDRDSLYFAVIDTGEGISAENINKLFQPFPQITDRYDSTGLGLTLSKELARLHGGDITVTSKLGKGSCFTLQIPLSSATEGKPI